MVADAAMSGSLGTVGMPVSLGSRFPLSRMNDFVPPARRTCSWTLVQLSCSRAAGKSVKRSRARDGWDCDGCRHGGHDCRLFGAVWRARFQNHAGLRRSRRGRDPVGARKKFRDEKCVAANPEPWRHGDLGAESTLLSSAAKVRRGFIHKGDQWAAGEKSQPASTG
jgi:hypothetical protein